MPAYKKIPFQLGAEILVRSSANRSHKTKSKIIGVLEKEFIMIENPVFIISDNIKAIVEDDLMIAYVYEGYLFTFLSRFNRNLIRNIVCIDYPDTFQIENLREEPRVKVNLATEININDMKMPGTVRNLSKSGASVEVPKIISIFKGLECIITFTLPNDQLIKNLRCKISGVKYNQIHKKTEISVIFAEPSEEISKIRELIRFCMRFKV